MSFTVQIDKEFFKKLFNEPQPYEPHPNEYLVPEIQAYIACEDNDLRYILFTELGAIDFLDQNNQNIDPTDETIDWDDMIDQAIELFIEFYNSEIKNK
jgi:hypothetical protein